MLRNVLRASGSMTLASGALQIGFYYLLLLLAFMIDSAVFARLMVVTDRPTDHTVAIPSVATGRI